MSISPAQWAFLSFVILALAAASVNAAGPTAGGGVASQPPETLKLAPFYVGDDGGAYYVREQGDSVFWFAEHPGRGYAHVFKGRRDGARITGRFISVPKGFATTVGLIRLRVQANGSLDIAEHAPGFAPRVLQPRPLASVLDQLPRPTHPQFGAPSRAELDGGYVDEAGRTYYMRQTGSTVVFAVESPAGRREQPRGVFVFIGERSGNAVAGEFVAVPKGLRTQAGTMRLSVLGDGMVNADSALDLFRDVRLRAITPKRQLRLLRARQPVEVTTQYADGVELLDGDIIVSGAGDRFRSAVVASQGKLWPDGVVPFVIDASISSAVGTEINKAIGQIQSVTNLRFVRRSDETDFVDFIQVPQLTSLKCTTCGQSQGPGRIGGKQWLRLTPMAPASTVVHELGHTVGLYHEQSRFDRDQFITIFWNNMTPDGRANFEKYVDKEMDYGPYDYHSIMHYSATDFGKPTGTNSALTTIQSKPPGSSFGNSQLSPHDIRGLEHLYAPVIQVSGLGDRGDGAGIAVTNLNADPRPDIILMAYDDAPGQNSFKYKIGFDVDDLGRTSHWTTETFRIDGLGERGDGAGIAIADIDGNGRPDMLLLAYDAANGQNSFKYKVCRDLTADGFTQGCGSRHVLPGVGHEGDGAGAVIGDVDGDGDLDLIVMAYDDAPGNERNSFKYVVGLDMKIDGRVRTFFGPLRVQGLGERGDGADILMLNFDGNNRPELMFMAYDDDVGQNSFKIHILKDITREAQSQQLSRWQYHGFGHRGDGAGMAAADLDGNGILELILMAYDPGNEANVFKYRVLRDALQP